MRLSRKQRFDLICDIEPTSTQVDRVFKAFNGVMGLVRALTAIGRYKSPSTLYRWRYARSKKRGAGGTGGMVPIQCWPDIFAAAEYEGIILSSEDVDPRIKS